MVVVVKEMTKRVQCMSTMQTDNMTCAQVAVRLTSDQRLQCLTARGDQAKVPIL